MRIIGLVALIVGLAGMGCTPTYVARWISIEMDSEGKVIKRTENEAVLQEITGEKEVIFNFIKIKDHRYDSYQINQ